MLVDIEIKKVIDREGGYVDDPSDRGGKTKYGVTEAVAGKWGYTGDMQDLPYEIAFKIYKARYWDSLRLDDVVEESETLAELMFDFGVNSGVSKSGKTLQRCLNSMNYSGNLFGSDLVVDGAVGGKTLNALKRYSLVRGKEGLEILDGVFNGVRKTYLLEITENNKTQRKFSYGWQRRVYELEEK